MAQEITYTDSSSVSITDGIELTGNVSILDIQDPEVVFTITTVCEGVTYIVDFIGARPTVRK